MVKSLGKWPTFQGKRYWPLLVQPLYFRILLFYNCGKVNYSDTLLSAQSNNQIHVHKVTVVEREIEASSVGKISLPGHREAPRAVHFSGDNRALVTASDSIKVWSVESCKCVRTVPMSQPGRG